MTSLEEIADVMTNLSGSVEAPKENVDTLRDGPISKTEGNGGSVPDLERDDGSVIVVTETVVETKTVVETEKFVETKVQTEDELLPGLDGDKEENVVEVEVKKGENEAEVTEIVPDGDKSVPDMERELSGTEHSQVLDINQSPARVDEKEKDIEKEKSQVLDINGPPTNVDEKEKDIENENSQVLDMNGPPENVDKNEKDLENENAGEYNRGTHDEAIPVDDTHIHVPNGNDQAMNADVEEAENVEELDDGEEHGFKVGDFVWAKIKSHPWWPGQIYDSSDASELLMKHSQTGRLLVAFFGDGSCSWCLPSQLVSFADNFQEMAKGSSSKNFLNAVKTAIDEVSRAVESEMTCKCLPEHIRIKLARPVASNAGVKSGVLVPQVDVGRNFSLGYEPVRLFSKLRNIAQASSVSNFLDLILLKCQISAFYCSKGIYQLPVYYPPQQIEGLEDMSGSMALVPVEAPVFGPLVDDWPSPAGSAEKLEDKIYQRRKNKSIAELMGEENDIGPKEGTDSGKPLSSKKRRKATQEEAENGVIGKKSSRKRKASEISGATKNKSLSVEVVANGNGDLQTEGNEDSALQIVVCGEGSENIFSPRERKVSKYLCPPYTNMNWRVGNSSFKQKSVVQPEKITKLARVEDVMTKSAGDLSAKTPVSKSAGKSSSKKSAAKSSGKKSEKWDRALVLCDNMTGSGKNDRMFSYSVEDVNASVIKLLAEVKNAATDPFYLSKNNTLDMVEAFVAAFRSSIYKYGLDYKAFHKGQTQKKRKLAEDLGNELIKDIVISREKETKKSATKKYKNEAEVPVPGAETSAESSKKSKKKADEVSGSETSKKKAAEISGSVGKAEKNSIGTSGSKTSAKRPKRKASSMSLILTFPAESALPSADVIMKIFGEFGALSETRLMKDSKSIEMVYVNDSDAESAFKSCVAESPLGTQSVNYKLKRSSPGPKSKVSRSEGDRENRDDVMADVAVVKQNLDVMTMVLEKTSPDKRAMLKDDVRGLVEIVGKTVEKVKSVVDRVSMQ